VPAGCKQAGRLGGLPLLAVRGCRQCRGAGCRRRPLHAHLHVRAPRGVAAASKQAGPAPTAPRASQQLATARPASDGARSMAEPRAATPPLWELLEQLEAELQSAILDLAGARALQRLRGACRAARALVNSRVRRVRLSADDLATLPLRLHERFPRLARLALAPGADGGPEPDTFADFAVGELARLSSLVELDLSAHMSLGTAAAVALRDCCPQLQSLDLGGTGAGSCGALLRTGRDPGAARHHNTLCFGLAGVASPYALQLLASLTRLTLLDLSNTGASVGLQQLTSLKGLAALSLDDCKDVTDALLQPLSALKGLTCLEADGTGVRGSSLAGLTSLQRLSLYRCSSLDAVAGLSAVAQLTRLTCLDVSHSAIGPQPAQLAQLAQLTNLQELWLWGHTIRDQAAALLQLPRLGELCADDIIVPQSQDLGGCAITRLALRIPAAAGVQTLPQLPTLQSLRIGTTHAGIISSISVQTQLTELAVGQFEGVQGSELAAGLRGLKQLQALELGHACCFDMECLRALAGLQQLQQLWLDGGRQGLAPGMGECWAMLHRCPQLQRVTLQRCGTISKGALLGLVFQLGMRQVLLRGAHGLAAEAVSELQELAAGEGCELLCEEEVCRGPLCDEYFTIPV
jgi:hypothetical protein